MSSYPSVGGTQAEILGFLANSPNRSHNPLINPNLGADHGPKMAEEISVDKLAAERGSRLSTLIARLGFDSQKAFAEAMSVGQDTVSMWVTGKSTPPRSRRAQIATLAGWSLGQFEGYFLHGEEVELAVPRRSNGRVRSRQRPLPPQNRIPLINSVTAAWGHEQSDMGYPADWADGWIDRGDIADPDARAFRVEGDSMEPELRAGEIVITSPALVEKIPPGAPCVVQFAADRNEENCIRFVYPKDGAVELRPANHRYGARTVPRESIEYLWPVVEVRRQPTWMKGRE